MTNYGLEIKKRHVHDRLSPDAGEFSRAVTKQGLIYKCNSMLGHPDYQFGHVKDQDV